MLCQYYVFLIIRQVSTNPGCLSLVVPGVDQDDVHNESDGPGKPWDPVEEEDYHDVLVLGQEVEDILDGYKLNQPSLYIDS